ncbi:MAG: hypothetical protein ABW159_09890 [Candidatus Thiodiazotropha sp.]
MDKKAVTSMERQRSCTRTISLMNMLSSSIGAKSVNNFAKLFDEAFSRFEGEEGLKGVDTESSRFWYPFFYGERPITDKQLDRLLCMDDQVKTLFSEGPSKLWVAMWGDVSELIAIIRDYNKSLSHMPLHFITKQVSRAIRDIDKGNRMLVDFVWSISFYRLINEVQPEALVDVENYPATQASCAWNLIDMCMNDDLVESELDALGIRIQVIDELSKHELERMRRMPVQRRLADVSLVPGFYTDFSVEEAERCGAFFEDALSYEDAIDSAHEDESFDETMAFSC